MELNFEQAPNATILKYILTTRQKLSEYKRIAISYSGGSDSDIIVDLIESVKPNDCGDIEYVFFDTGLEYDATHRHIKDIELRYNIKIDKIKPVMSIPTACKRYGAPFISKYVSEMIQRLMSHGYIWDDNEPPNCRGAFKWFNNLCGENSKLNIDNIKLLREFIKQYPPNFLISDKCCKYAKKDVSKGFDKEFQTDLRITGMRQAEGGRRTISIKSCFSVSKEYDEYRPLWFWSDRDKELYKAWRDIRFSDCYEIWGLKRTGCVGCPCSSTVQRDLRVVAEFEPRKTQAAYNVFGESYRYRQAFHDFKYNNGLDQIKLEECFS